MIALDLEPMPVAMIKLTDVESGRVLANLEGATPFAQCREMLVVVFGPVERGDAVGEVFEQFPTGCGDTGVRLHRGCRSPVARRRIARVAGR